MASLTKVTTRLAGLSGSSRAAATNFVRTYGMGSHVSDNDPKVLDNFKERHLKGQTKSTHPEDAPGWEEHLASDSEAIVKAERAGGKSVKEMQEQTIKTLKEDPHAQELATGSGEGTHTSSSGRE